MSIHACSCATCHAARMAALPPDTAPVVPIARYQAGEVAIEVYTNDVLRVPCDAIIHGAVASWNPFGVIFEELGYWKTIDHEWTPTQSCPPAFKHPALFERIDEEVVVGLPSNSLTNARFIACVHPKTRTIADQLERTLTELNSNPRLNCQTLAVLSPGTTADAPASVVVAGVLAFARKAKAGTVVKLVDIRNATPYVEALNAVGWAKNTWLVRDKYAAARFKLPYSYGIVTAENPGNDKLGAEENAERTAQLRADLTADGKQFFEIDGGNVDWTHKERSFAISASKDDIIALGTKWKQLAVFWVEDGNLNLVFCDAPDNIILLDKFKNRLLR